MTAAGAFGTLGLPFEVGQKRAHADHDYTNIVGMEIEGLEGARYRLVRADGANTAPAKQAFEYNDATLFDVAQTDTLGDRTCGFAVTDQVALADNDYFWLQIEGRVTGIDSGSGVTAGDYLQTTAAGEVITDAAHVEGVSELRALATAAADADVSIQILKRLVG